MKKILFACIIIFILFSCKKVGEPGEAEIKYKAEKLKEDQEAAAEKERIERENAAFMKDSLKNLNIKSFRIKRIEGKDGHGDATAVAYSSLFQVMQRTKEESEREMRTPEEINSALQACKNVCPGGEINVIVTRWSKTAGGTSNFFIIVKDMAEKEILRKTYPKNSEPLRSSKHVFINSMTLYVEKPLDAPFYVYLVDRAAKQTFKYKVSPVYRKN